MDFTGEFDELIALWSDGDLEESILERPTDEVLEFVETLSLSSRFHNQGNRIKSSNFTFIANSSLSGGKHPCSAPDCRFKKLSELASFSTLYADVVYIQDPFEDIFQFGTGEMLEGERHELIASIYNYLFLKPLIEEGVVKYAQNMVALCDHHGSELAAPLKQQIESKGSKLYDAIHEYLIERCEVVFDLTDEGTPFLFINGPEGMIAHGGQYFHFYKPYPELATDYMKKQTPVKLTKDEVRKEGILDIIISPITEDLARQEWHSSFYGSSYLCDSRTQVKLASKVNPQEVAINSRAFEEGMKHSLPTVYSKNISSVLSLRKKEEEAFAVYRDRMRKVMTEVRGSSEKEVVEAFQDIVLPELNLINKKVRDWKVGLRESIKEKTIFGSGAVSIGLYSGILPPNIASIVAAVGGASAVSGILMDYNKSLKDAQEARKNDFYFLWKANRP